jgi:phosphoribosylformylglycinamidine synthase
MRFGVVVFPGSNCDHDAWYAVSHNLGHSAQFIWHDSSTLGEVDAVILPGGFSYGDYLRCGAIAKFSPVMKAVQEFASRGGLVLGICNGFQVLCESGLLPGVLIRNESLKFVCKEVNLRVERADTRFTTELGIEEVIRIPIAHGEGNFIADDNVLADIESNGQVLFRYSDEDGNTMPEANPNGSLNNIAGIINKDGNVMGLMPHPERACEAILGSADGRKIFESLRKYFIIANRVAVTFKSRRKEATAVI